MKVRFCFSCGIYENSEEFEYDYSDFEGMEAKERNDLISDDLFDWVENQIEYHYEIIEDE